MASDADSDKTSQPGLIQSIQNAQREANAEIRYSLARAQSLAVALETVDIALMKHIALRGLDQQAELHAAGQRLAALLETGADNV